MEIKFEKIEILKVLEYRFPELKLPVEKIEVKICKRNGNCFEGRLSHYHKNTNDLGFYYPDSLIGKSIEDLEWRIDLYMSRIENHAELQAEPNY